MCIRDRHKGFDADYFNSLSELESEKDFIMMVFDWDLAEKSEKSLKIMEASQKTMLFVQPNNFPEPWCRHPNFMSCLDQKYIDKLNNIPNIRKWTFVEQRDSRFYDLWRGNIQTINLAYDSINYEKVKKEEVASPYDLCYVGSWANNGFDEKKKILMEYFKALKESGLKCGIFINKGLTLEQESNLLANTKVGLNIHDNHARILKFDTNERTFKTLGLTGMMASDNQSVISRMFSEIDVCSNDSIGGLIDGIRGYLELPVRRIEDIKKRNRDYIMENHTYIKRVEEMLLL